MQTGSNLLQNWRKLGGAFVLFPAVLHGSAVTNIEKDFYVLLYENRAVQAHLNVEVAKVEHRYAKWYLSTLEKIAANGAVPRAELLLKRAVALQAELQVERLQQAAKERSALVEAVKAMRRSGKEVPVFGLPEIGKEK